MLQQEIHGAELSGFSRCWKSEPREEHGLHAVGYRETFPWFLPQYTDFVCRRRDDDLRNFVQPVSSRACFPHLARCLPRRRSLQEANTGRIEHRLFGFQPEFLRNRYCILTTVNNHPTILTSILYSFCFRLFHFFKVIPLLSTYLKALRTIPIV